MALITYFDTILSDMTHFWISNQLLRFHSSFVTALTLGISPPVDVTKFVVIPPLVVIHPLVVVTLELSLYAANPKTKI